MKTHGRNCTVLPKLEGRAASRFVTREFSAASSVRPTPAVLPVRTARLSLRSSNNAYILPLIYFCPGKEIQVMSVVPGIELLGPYRRIYDNVFIQRIMIDAGPEDVLLEIIDLAYAPGSSGPVLSRAT
jgi:hypothetical protein